MDESKPITDRDKVFDVINYIYDEWPVSTNFDDCDDAAKELWREFNRTNDYRDFCLHVVQEYEVGYAIKYMTPEIQDDREIVKLAVQHQSNQQDWTAYECVSDRLKNDREIAALAVKADGGNLLHVPKHFLDDKELVMKADFSFNTESYSVISPRLAADKDIFSKALKESPYIIRYAPAYQDDKSAVLSAVSMNGNTLEYASSRLKDDNDVALAALKDYRYAVEHTSPRIQKICGDSDNPAEAFEIHLAYEKMQSTLAQKAPPIKQVAKLKI